MPALGHRAESAAARAQVAQDHERRRAAMETFMHVGAARRFAHGVQIQPAKLGLELMDGVKMRARFAKPLGQTRRGRSELNQRVHVRLTSAKTFFLIGFFAREARILQIGASLVDVGIGDRSHQNAKHARFLGDLGRDGGKLLLAQKLDHDLGFVMIDRRKLQVRFPGFRLIGGRGAGGRLRGCRSHRLGWRRGLGRRTLAAKRFPWARSAGAVGLAVSRVDGGVSAAPVSFPAGGRRLPGAPTGEEFRPTM